MKNSWQSRWLQRWGIPVVVIMLAFLPRAISPLSRPIVWYERSIHFSNALLAKKWAETYQRYHPGVTVMWLSGIGLRLFAWQRGLSPGQMLGIEPTKPGTLNDAVAAGVLPLAFVVSLCIALSYVLLSRITERRVAFAGSCLLALDPCYTAYSKEIHPDALLATFMFISILFLHCHLRQAKQVDLVLSGVFAGLALLTKVPALFLVPYTALAVATYKLIPLEASTGAKGGRRKWVRELWTSRLWDLIFTLLTWGGTAAVVFIVLWPAMWVKPFAVLSRMADKVFYHVETPRPNPLFFNGQVTFEDPGLPFYLVTIAWKTTWITLPMACAALIFALFGLRRGKYSRMVWLLIAYIVFFTIQMGLGEYKQISYLLPVFPALDVVAAFGLVQSAEVIGRVRWWRKWDWLPVTFIALVLVLQAGVVLPLHPYYGTHHNHLLGGSRVAQHILPLQEQGEGLDLAALYLNTLPGAQRSRVLIYRRNSGVFKRKFVGLTSTDSDPWATYRVYYINQVMRHLGGEEWEKAWNADRQTIPLWSVAFDGVTYVWVYGAPPGEPAAGGPEREVDYRLGEHIQLKRVRLSSETFMPGETLTVVLVWESDGQVKENYMVFCHVLSASGDLVAQRDGSPVYGVRPTPSWGTGEVIEDIYEIFLDADLAPGEYELSVGMYDAESLERLAVYDAAGKRLPDDRIAVGSLRVEAPGASGE